MYANGTKGLGEYRQEKESIYLVLMSSSDKALKEHSTSEQAMDGICKFMIPLICLSLHVSSRM